MTADPFPESLLWLSLHSGVCLTRMAGEGRGDASPLDPAVLVVLLFPMLVSEDGGGWVGWLPPRNVL